MLALAPIPIRRYRFIPPPLPGPDAFEAFKHELADPARLLGTPPSRGDVRAELILMGIFSTSLAIGLALDGSRYQTASAVFGFFGGLMAFGTLLSLLSLWTAFRWQRIYNARLREQALKASNHALFMQGFGPTHEKYARAAR
jgi:hypothetical protein